MSKFDEYKELFENYLSKELLSYESSSLYEPFRYALSSGGKRLRPVLCLLGCKLFNGDIRKALPLSAAIEILHNFTLVHDDIMDNSPLRRGKPTVFKKWNSNIAILAGDAMFAKVFEYIIKVEDGDLKTILSIFTETALKICQGQQYDLDYETKNIVSIEEYLQMIFLKTAVLFGASLKLGAIMAKATEIQIEKIYNFGTNMGYIFQLLDDYLDLFGNPQKTGKEIGQDIVSSKKTFLYLKALELLKGEQRKKFQSYYSNKSISQTQKINKTKRLYEDLNIKQHTLNIINIYYTNALNYLNSITDCNIEIKNELKQVLDSMIEKE